MENLVTSAIPVSKGFFAIMNPISDMPLFFIPDRRGGDEKSKQNINKRAIVIAFIIVNVFLLLGKFIFELFEITIPAFKITGRILIFFGGFEMLQSKKSNVKHLKNTNIDVNIAVSPLAIPMMAGPGTFATAINSIISICRFRRLSRRPKVDLGLECTWDHYPL